jgi:hypothetical protein
MSVELVDYFDAMLASDAIMPSQFYPGREFPPEKRLILAVLEDALRIVVREKFSGNLSRQRTMDDACDWIAARGTWLMSFDWVCEALEIDAEALREKILSIRPPESGKPALLRKSTSNQVLGRRSPITIGSPRRKFQRIGLGHRERLGGVRRQDQEW